MVKNVLVVCTGNICRSPMAQAWLQSRWGSDVVVESAGIGALVGHGADQLAIQVAAQHGLDLRAHCARQVDLEMLRRADLVLAMDSSHRRFLIRLAPWATGKVWCYGHHEGKDVDDPYKLGLDAFLMAFDSIQRQGETWISIAKAL